jgi:hypothetical protein
MIKLVWEVWYVDMIFNVTAYERRYRKPPHPPRTVYIPLEVPFAVSP